MQDLLGKKALVTGGSRGIGAAIAILLAKRGADVAITYEKSADKANSVVQGIQAQGRKGLAIQADSKDANSITQAVENTVAQLGGIDILVNNAGINAGGSLPEMSVEEIDAVIAVNIRGVVLFTRATIPHLQAGGRIISIGSCLAERVAFEGATVYSMTKSALLAFTRGLARDLGGKGITVNNVHPGPTDTDMNPADGDHADGLRALGALGQYATVDDIAESVAFLASPAAKQITGSNIVVDGGTNA